MATLSIFAQGTGEADLTKVTAFFLSTLTQFGVVHNYKRGDNGAAILDKWSGDGQDTSAHMF